MSASTIDQQLHFSIKNPTKINLNLTASNQASRPISSLITQNNQQQQPITSNPMIVNSHPYNPSQVSQQQRCVGLNQQKQQQIDPSRLLNSQQNSIYGSSFNQLTAAPTTTATTMNRHQQQSHMLDLANLQQGVFESAYDIASSNNNANQSDQRRLNELSQLQQANDTSLYSPSSSTSLLYHIYDQINLPSELSQQQQQQQPQYQHDQLIGYKNNNNTTILNPANLFGNNNNNNDSGSSGGSNTSNNSNVNHQLISGNGNNQQALPLPMQLHQVSELQKNFAQQQQQQQQNYYGGSITANSAATSAAQNQYSGQQAFNTLHHHLQHPSSTYLSNNNNNNLMLDSVMRQHATLRQQHHHFNNNQQRPLSSSGVSSLSNQSVPITYGRQPRTSNMTNSTNISGGGGVGKSQSNLASVLQSSNTLNHLGILNNCSSPNTLNRNEKSLFNNNHITTHDHFRGFKQRLRNYIYEYKTIVKCSILLILLALSLMSIIKFTLFTGSSSNPPSMSTVPSLQNNYNHHIASSNHLSNPLLNHPSLINNKPTELGTDNAIVSPQPDTNGEDSSEQTRQQDVLKSKLLIGEFVILSQNYTNSASQKALLAEHIVKLMEQVFLATDVRKVYSRMEVTNIRENRPSGLVVDCNIVLSESIAYAAQQFGIALYDSLAKSHERLANQPGYIIDKNSIRFNTVPDKDITSGIVPPGLISPQVSKELEMMSSGHVAPPVTHHSKEPDAPNSMNPDLIPNIENSQANLDNLNSVVWSAWSPWSSCVDKNGICDPARLHSRLRKCVAQHTGERVEPSQCKQRFNMHDQELEVDDCSKMCNQQQASHSAPPPDNIMSDAPSVIGPQTAPSVLVNNEPSSMMPSYISSSLQGASNIATGSNNNNKPSMSAITSGSSKDNSNSNSNLVDVYTPPAATLNNQAASPSAVGSPSVSTPTTEKSDPNVVSSTLMPLVEQQHQHQQQQQLSQMSCSNCTSDEICLLLMQQKVPFCAKIKDRRDESGCGGWCKAQNQLCQPVGQNAFKCIHDSECLAEEWRCHDSACIPLSKRCDGHSNCYDSSDERDCPII